MGILCPSTNLLDRDILLIQCQMQTSFQIQVILHLLYATMLCVKEDQSKILTGIKIHLLIYVQYFDNKVGYQSLSCKENGELQGKWWFLHQKSSKLMNRVNCYSNTVTNIYSCGQFCLDARPIKRHIATYTVFYCPGWKR